MDKKRLEELRLKQTLFTCMKGEGGAEYTFQDCYDIMELIDAELAKQSAMDEAVQRAIEYFEDTLQFISGSVSELDHRLAIEALRQMRIGKQLDVERGLNNVSRSICDSDVSNSD